MVTGISPSSRSELASCSRCRATCDGEIEVGEQADGGPAVPGLPADDLPGVQAGGLLAELVILSIRHLADATAISRDGGTGPGVQHR